MRSAQVFEIPIVHKSTLPDDKRTLIKNRILAATVNGRLYCSGALAIAEGLGVSSKDVGLVADELAIKISKCQLGCF